MNFISPALPLADFENLFLEKSKELKEDSRKTWLRRFFDEFLTKKNYEQIRELFSEDVKSFDAMTRKETTGIEDVMKSYQHLHRAFPNSVFAAEQILVAEDNTIFVRWSFKAEHHGVLSSAFGDVQPTGRKVSICGLSMFQFNSAGKVSSFKRYYDAYDVLQQIGFDSEFQKGLARKFADMFSRGDYTGFEDIVSHDATFSEPTNLVIRDRDEVKKHLMGWNKKVQDMKTSVLSIKDAGGHVVLEWKVGGTVNGKAVEIEGVDVYRIRNRKIADIWTMYNNAILLGQVGLLGKKD